MREPVKYFLERTTPLGRLARLHRTRKLRRKYEQWQSRGSTGPMPNFGKQKTVIEYIKRFSPEVFVETGTYKGKMVYAVMPYIDEIYSIELSGSHYSNAARRFCGYPKVHILQGESSRVLPEILANIDKRCIFWLDAHWSGGSTARAERQTPVMQEVQCILKHKKAEGHVILIDDARLFTGDNDYPSIPELREQILQALPGWCFEVKNDIVRTHANAGND